MDQSKYRYVVDASLFEITPLASVELFLGNIKLRVHNISMGGISFLLEKAPHFEANALLDVSISLRERAFPQKIEVKKINGLRVSASFVNAAPAFSMALREYLAPKSLGAGLVLQAPQKDLPEALALVPESLSYEPYIGPNQTGVLVWLGAHRSLQRLLAVSRDLVLGWEPGIGFRTGKLNSEQSTEVSWDRIAEITVHNYLADILVAWMSRPDERAFIETLFVQAPGADSSGLRFPYKA